MNNAVQWPTDHCVSSECSAIYYSPTPQMCSEPITMDSFSGSEIVTSATATVCSFWFVVPISINVNWELSGYVAVCPLWFKWKQVYQREASLVYPLVANECHDINNTTLFFKQRSEIYWDTSVRIKCVSVLYLASRYSIKKPTSVMYYLICTYSII